jgi:serine/threonine protein kinase
MNILLTLVLVTGLMLGTTTAALRMADVELQVVSSLYRDPSSIIERSLWTKRYESVNISLLGGPSEDTRWTGGLVLLRELPVTRVFEVHVPRHLPPTVLVYKRHCQSAQRPVNTMGYDYWFLQYLHSSGLVPRVYDLSGPIFSDEVGHKAGKLRNLKCAGGIQAEIRYMLMEKIEGRSLYELFRDSPSPLPISTAITYAIRMVRALETLHSHDVVHGDAHWGNFMVAYDDEIKMIDFEHAIMFHPDEYSNPRPYPAGGITAHGWSSPWEARGFPSSFRDDVHRVLLSLAVMIHGDTYFKHFQALTKTAPHIWLNFRSRGHIFHVPSLYAMVSNPDAIFSLEARIPNPRQREAVVDRFVHIEQLVIQMHIRERPDYDTLVDLLIEARDLLNAL